MSSKFLSTTLAGLTLGLALVATSPALANGGIKDSRAVGTPVPAPIPVMEHFRWYLRADIGLGMYGSASGSEHGLLFGAQDSAGLGALAPISTSSSWFNEEFNTFATAGVGLGLYLSPRVRGDVTIDTRTHSNIIGNGSYTYDQQSFVVLGGPAPTGVQVRGSHFEKVEVRGTTTLVNAYYDLADRGGLTPYIGAGLGFVVRSFQRTATTNEQFYDTTAVPTTLVGTRTSVGQGKAHPVAPAAALTVGTAYSLQSGVVLDFNYRYMYLGGAESSSMINGSQSFLKIGDSHEHALRAGVRVNVW